MSIHFRRLALSLAVALSAPALQAEPFTYQGHLEFNETPVHGSADLVFRLFDSESGGSPIDSPVQVSDWPVAQGIFTIDLDFSGVAFDGSPRWLQVEANGQVLAGRIPVLGAPFAHSANALRGRSVAAIAPATGQVLSWNGSAWGPADAATGASYQAGAGLELSGETFSILPDYRLPQSCSSDQVVKWNGSAWTCAADAGESYSAGAGLILVGAEFSVAPAFRLPAGCGGNAVAKWNGSDWFCATDADTTYSAGEGLALQSGSFSLAQLYRLPQGCPQGSVPRLGVMGWGCESWEHEHFGAAWSGSADAPGLAVTQSTNESGWAALRGTHLGSATTGVGVQGDAPGPAGGVGVRGSGSRFGVSGSVSAAAAEAAVHGRAEATSSAAAGVKGVAEAADSRGVLGQHSHTAGVAIEGRATAVSGTGIGVQGVAESSTGTGVRGLGGVAGVLGSSSNVNGYGVFGYNLGNGDGSGIGVRADSDQPSGAALSAQNTANAGPAVAVQALSYSNSGTAIRGTAGLPGTGDGIGVEGIARADTGTGVRGGGFVGVYGSGAFALYGLASGPGDIYAVYGGSYSSRATGVFAGLESTSGATRGVVSMVRSPDGIGVLSENVATTGNGLALRAESNAVDGLAGEVIAHGSGSSMALRAVSNGELAEATALQAVLANGSGAGTALVAEHRGGGVAARLDGVLRMTPRPSPPADCALGDLYVHDSGGLCFCNAAQAWERINATGACP